MSQDPIRQQAVEVQRTQPGAPPGTLVRHHEGETSIQVIAYDENRVEQKDNVALEELRAIADGFRVVWVKVVGLADLQRIESLGKLFGIHQLTLEDIVNLQHAAKFEAFETYDYFIARTPEFIDRDDSSSVITEQLSIVLVDNLVITFERRETDCPEPVRQRILERSGLIRHRGADYLVYALLDSVIDHYFPILDTLADRVAEFDDLIASEDANVSVKCIHQLRRQLLSLARVVRPHREMVSRLLREPSRFAEKTRLFLGDCFDHLLQLTELIDMNREICSDLRSYHLAVVGNRANEVMKTLTIISSIFIPLSFIAGLYGMNFANIPELNFRYGYFVTLALMASVASALLLWFRKKGWFGS